MCPVWTYFGRFDRLNRKGDTWTRPLGRWKRRFERCYFRAGCEGIILKTWGSDDNFVSDGDSWWNFRTKIWYVLCSNQLTNAKSIWKMKKTQKIHVSWNYFELLGNFFTYKVRELNHLLELGFLRFWVMFWVEKSVLSLALKGSAQETLLHPKHDPKSQKTSPCDHSYSRLFCWKTV